MSKVTIVALTLLTMMYTCQGALDEHRVPTTHIGFFASLSDYCTLNLYRESTTLSAFEKNINDPNDQEALATFKKKFRPEYCRKHPELIEKAIKHNRSDLLEFMEVRLNVRDTFKHCADRDPAMRHPLHWLVQNYGDKSVETITVMATVLKFDPTQKDDKDNTVLYVATQKNALEVQKKLMALSGSDTPLHIVAGLQPPSAYEALFEELLKYGFDVKSRDAQGKTVSDLNNEQEECYCNPPHDSAILTPKELKKRGKECLIVEARKNKVTQRREEIYGKNVCEIFEEQKAEIAKNGAEAAELEKKREEEEAKIAEDALLRQKEEEKIALAALSRKKLHGDNQTIIMQETEESKRANDELREKTLRKINRKKNNDNH